MKKLLLAAPMLFCFYFNLSAQGWGGGGTPQPITGKITGKVVDAKTNEPVEFATVVLVNSEFGKQLDGSITDEKGKFKFSKVALKEYEIEISFIGYETQKIRKVQLTKKRPDVKLKTIQLQPDTKVLDEVEVTAERSLIENKVDKLVYNADQDVTNAGGDATDVLRKVPMLSVDLEGNVSLRGSQNIQILINGKPSGIFANSVADALKLIPADEIKKVEVITTPSAKYDGEGSGGIINIITKRKGVEGFSGSINTSVGTRQNNAVVSLSASKGRVGLNGSASAYYSWPNDGSLDFESGITSEGVTSTLIQNGITNTERLGFNGKFGAYYDINAYNSINSNFSFNGFTMDQNGLTTTTNNNPLIGIFETYNRTSDGGNLFSGFDWTTDYKKTFDKKERELVIAYQLSENTNDRSNRLVQDESFSFVGIDEENVNDGKNIEHTIQLDYTHPFSKKIKMEVGGKTVLRDIKSDFSSRNRTTNTFNEFRTDIFDYNQNVMAGYLSFNIDLGKKFGLTAGARYEHTNFKGSFRVSDSVEPFDETYDNLLPSIILSRKLKGFSSIKLSYNKRIQRPSLFFVNPYPDISDPRNVLVGNPQLLPEITHQIDLSYNTFVKGTVVYASLYYKYTDDAIESIVGQEPLFSLAFLSNALNNSDSSLVNVTRFLNLGTRNNLGLNVFSQKTIKFWTIRGNLNMSRYGGEGIFQGERLEAVALLYNAFISSSFDLKKGWKAELWGFWNSPRQTIQGFNPSFSMYSVGIRKQLWNKRGSIGFNAIDPFNRTKFFRSETAGTDWFRNSSFGIPFRSFGINFSYKFGKLDFKAKSRKASIKNDDMKQGDGGGGQGMGGGQGQGS
ncbi:MAG: TonB-dependent receptor [Bacteroidota bacterium]